MNFSKTKTYFITTEKARELSGQKRKGSKPKYHASPACRYTRDSSMDQIDEQFIVDHNLKPCKGCFAEQSPPQGVVRSATNDQIAAVMLLHGTPEQQKEALAYCADEVSSLNMVSSTKPQNFPQPVQITLWTCSDGREFSTELEALRYELDICLHRQSCRKQNGVSHLKDSV